MELTRSGTEPITASSEPPTEWLRGRDRPSRPLRAVLVPSAVIALAYFCYTLPFLGSLPLTGGMEANVVIAAREAVRDGHWLPGTQNGAPRVRKPPLAHWTTAAGVALAREWPSATAARWPTLLMASLMLVATVYFGTILFDAPVGIASGLIAGTSALFLMYARKASYDTQIALWVTIADAFLAAALFRSSKSALAAAGVALGLAVMTKGPVGLLQGAAPAIAYALLRWWRGWDDDTGAATETIAGEPGHSTPARQSGAAGWWIAGLIAAAIFTAIVLPWTVIVLRDFPGIRDVWRDQLTRKVDSVNGGNGNWFAYFGVIPTLWPWVVWPFVGMVAAIRGETPRDRRARALLVWTILPLFVMSFAPGRRWRYCIPLIPPAAVLAAYGLQLLASDLSRTARVLRAAHWLGLIGAAAGGLVACALGLAGCRAAAGGPSLHWPLAVAGIVAIAAVAYASTRARFGRSGLLYGSVACVAIGYPLAIFAYSHMKGAIPETDQFIGRIVAAHPGAVYYSAKPRFNDPPLEMVIYADRVIWNIGDLSALRPVGREQVAVRPEGRNPVQAPPPFQLLGRCWIDGQYWGAYLLPADPNAPPPTVPPVIPGIRNPHALWR